MSRTYSAGIATAYGAAVRGGYTGTYEQWCALMADYATVGQGAAASASAAANSATTAESWAVGGTSTRTGEDTNNASYYAGQSASHVSEAEAHATAAESWAVGDTASRTGENTNNAMYYATQADASATEAESWAVGGTESRTGEDTNNASYYATQASTSATAASTSATEAESWAVGGTSSRTGEDTNNASYYATQAGNSASAAAASAESAAQSDYDATVLAPAYDTTKTYAVGDYVTHTGKLYRCISAITTAEAWTTAHWTEVAVGAEISDLKIAINDIETVINYVPQDIQFDKSLNTSGGTGVLPTNIATEYNWACICVPCAPGDAFTVTGTGGSNARLWAFADSEGVVIDQAASGATGNELKKTAPTNAAYFAYNVRYKQNGVLLPYGVYKGEKPVDRFAQIADDIDGINDSVGDLSEDLDDALRYDQTDDVGTDMTWTNGYVNKGGTPKTNDSYHYSEPIPVNEGDILSTSDSFRYLTAYVNGVANSDLGKESVTSYVVGPSVTTVVVSLASDKTSIMHTYKVSFEGLASHVKAIEDKIEGATFNNNKTVVSASASTLTNGQVLTACQNIDNKKGDTIVFYANVDAQTFGSVTVGHGQGISYGASVKVDATKITTAYGTNADYYHTDHNLRIDKFLMIEIIHTNNARASVRLVTASGSFEVSSNYVAWGGCKGDVFALSTNSALSNVKLSCTFADFERDIFLFGDSYVGLGDPTKYTTVLINNGYTNLMIDGFGGRKSAEALVSFRNIIQMAKPKYAIWALGMNNPDATGMINASYKSCLDEFIQTCEANGIIPILATIPNTPERLNTGKNDYIKLLVEQHSYRYIDFAAAVGAEEAESTWYAGMLEELSQTVLERVHPTALGAEALYARFLIDVPEIANLE